jgi:hypothetical protein
MKYEKPTVLDLNARAVQGQNPLACLAGTGVATIDCAPGAADLTTACYAGTNGYTWADDCMPGLDALSGNGSCFAGIAAYECSAGGTATAHNPTCTTGAAA